MSDPLGDVHSTTTDGETRINEHFERGVQAGCWDRSQAKAEKARKKDHTS